LLALTSTTALAAGGPTQLVVSAGPRLRSLGGASGNLAATLNGSDQTVGATLANYVGQDATGTGSGWNVTFQATLFACTAGTGQCPTGGDTLPTSSLLMAPPVACNTGTSCAGRAAAQTIGISTNTALDSGTAVKVASAAAKKSIRSTTFTPANISGLSAPLSLAGRLTIPAWKDGTQADICSIGHYDSPIEGLHELGRDAILFLDHYDYWRVRVKSPASAVLV
jgi:hypothetical protein